MADAFSLPFILSCCALILKKSDFYLCICNFLDAVVAIEKVAEHINEMQRITEQFSPVFHQLVVECGGFEVILSRFWRSLCSGPISII